MRDINYILAALLCATLSMLAFSECGTEVSIDLTDELTMDQPVQPTPKYDYLLIFPDSQTKQQHRTWRP